MKCGTQRIALVLGICIISTDAVADIDYISTIRSIHASIGSDLFDRATSFQAGYFHESVSVTDNVVSAYAEQESTLDPLLIAYQSTLSESVQQGYGGTAWSRMDVVFSLDTAHVFDVIGSGFQDFGTYGFLIRESATGEVVFDGIQQGGYLYDLDDEFTLDPGQYILEANSDGNKYGSVGLSFTLTAEQIPAPATLVVFGLACIARSRRR